MILDATIAALLVAGISTASTLPSRCKEVAFTVSATAPNLLIPSNAVSEILGSLQSGTNVTLDVAAVNTTNYGTNSVAGTETLAGWYCQPSVNNANNTKLEIFRGSFFTNREMWTAFGGTALFDPPLSQYQPANYSWVDYANNLGYATLAIDNLGQGASSRPDGLLVAQIPYEVNLYHDLVTQIKAGTTGQLPYSYETLFHVGNSLGSIIGNNHASNYPDDFDAYVLTGFSEAIDEDIVGVALNLPAPAVLVNATRFAGVPLTYVTSTIQDSLTNSFFGVPTVADFDPECADLFFARRDTVSLGDVVTTYVPGPVGITPAPAYTGRILVLTGENDQAFCGLGSALLSPDAQCGSLLKDTNSLFPNADYNYQSVPATGHAIVIHRSSLEVFRYAHDFLAGESFAG